MGPKFLWPSFKVVAISIGNGKSFVCHFIWMSGGRSKDLAKETAKCSPKNKRKTCFKFPHMTKHKKERKPQMFDMKTFPTAESNITRPV